MTHRSAHRRLAGWAALALATLSLAACGVRWETAPVDLPEPDAATVARDSLALAEQLVADAAAADSSSAGTAALRVAQAHLDVLGPVYEPFPSLEPSPTAAPSLPAVEVAIGAARLTAERVAADRSLGEISQIATSLDLSWALHQRLADGVDAGTMGATATAPQALPLPDGTASDGGFTPGTDTALSQEDIAALALAHDQARFAYETVAALEQGESRTVALALADAHAQRADALAVSLDEDPRTPLYQLRDTDLLDAPTREGLTRGLELDLGARYAALAVVAAEPDRAWLANATYDAYVRAMTSPGFTAGDLPSLPGLEVTEAITATTPSASATSDEG